MKITLNDLQQVADMLQTRLEEYSGTIERELFTLYEKSKDIFELEANLENCTGGDYTFDNYGDFIYQIEVPKDIAALPSIKEYLERDYDHVYIEGKTMYLYHTHGAPIVINRSAGRNEYFVYCTDTRKEVLAKTPNASELLISAAIAYYQTKTGCFNDVIEIDRNGGYSKHYEFVEGVVDKTQDELLLIIEQELMKDEEE